MLALRRRRAIGPRNGEDERPAGPRRFRRRRPRASCARSWAHVRQLSAGAAHVAAVTCGGRALCQRASTFFEKTEKCGRGEGLPDPAAARPVAALAAGGGRASPPSSAAPACGRPRPAGRRRAAAGRRPTRARRRVARLSTRRSGQSRCARRRRRSCRRSTAASAGRACVTARARRRRRRPTAAEADTRERVAQIAADNAGYRLWRRTRRRAAARSGGADGRAARGAAGAASTSRRRRADREALHRDLGASIAALARARLPRAATPIHPQDEVAEMNKREKARLLRLSHRGGAENEAALGQARRDEPASEYRPTAELVDGRLPAKLIRRSLRCSLPPGSPRSSDPPPRSGRRCASAGRERTSAVL